MPRPRLSLTLAAFLVACTGVALFSVMDAVMKSASLAIGAYNALWWRGMINIALCAPLYFATRKGWPSRGVLWLHIWRGIVVAFMAILFFWSVMRLPLAEAIALSFIAPLIALYLAAVLLKERIGSRAIAASILGLAGVAVIMLGRFGGGNYAPDALWGVASVLGSAVLFAYNLVLARQQAQLAGPAEIALFQNLTVFGLLSFAAPWLAVLPAAAVFPSLALAALLSVVSLLLMSWAYARAEAQILIPVEYTAFIWAAICGWFAFDEALTWPVIGGTVLIVAGCLIAARVRPQPGQVEEAFA
jgi:S-adenosylmethionine uptake transporter